MRRGWAGLLPVVAVMTGLSSTASSQQSSDGKALDKDGIAVVVVIQPEGARRAELTDGAGSALRPLVPPDSSGMDVYLMRPGEYQVTFNGADPILLRAKARMGNLILVGERRTQTVSLRGAGIPLAAGGDVPRVIEPAGNVLNFSVR